ncbi:hypothetical protein F3Y22_tig00117027pilonHSYRG00012 [Hibiscus syriacus]|uniref:RRM domain-containing protein n=1 Tax=Hibiscus syriacus TaxID=106335 RepID=A0A6A2X0H9_HIBSY|nr:hypothetical protein F3Y22_tig00117027pilonHSYRG00012 [Hibiscus syriacus]
MRADRSLLTHTVFVNFVSKRIHPATLKEAFMEYGVVVDVFIAYRSRRRLYVGSTFAFVRYRRKNEASVAVRRADGRLMDDYRIKVFHEKSSEQISNRYESGKEVKRVWKPALRDSRSYKDTLGGRKDAGLPQDQAKAFQHSGIVTSGAVIHVNISDDSSLSLNRDKLAPNSNIMVPKYELRWRESCLVGKIKKMYNEDIILTAFMAEGFDVRVSIWQEALVVIQFKGTLERKACWDSRDEWLRTWFDELEFLEGYEQSLKRKIWVILIDVPLLVWSNKFLNELGNLWGSVVSIHEETRNRIRFDEAKILLEVQCASVVPDRCSVLINGRVFSIKILTEVHEEERVFIDGTKPGGGMVAPADDGVARFPRLLDGAAAVDGFESGCMGDSLLEIKSKMCEHSFLKSRYTHVVSAVGIVEAVGDELHEVPIMSNDGPLNVLVDDSIGFVDINRESAQLGAVWGGIRVFPSPVDRDTVSPSSDGIFKSAVGKAAGGASKNSISQKGGQVLFSAQSLKKKKSVKGRKKRKISGSSQIRIGSTVEEFLVQPSGNDIEAEACLAVADTLGVQFGASRKRVLQRLASSRHSGLGKAEKIRAVSRVINSNKARVVLLQESKVVNLLVGIERRLKGRFVSELVCAPAEGASGGLISLWDSCSNVYKRFIVLKGLIVHLNLEIGIINVYGPNTHGERVSFFDQLNLIIENLKVPIIVGGDFNIVRSDLEITGVHNISCSMLVFEDFISKWDLVDIPISGSVFTWFRGGLSTTANRLDRFLISADIVCLSPTLVQATLHRGLSDHNPILLCEGKLKKVCRQFKWFNHWADDPSLADKIRMVFGANHGQDLSHVLLLTKKVTKDWVEARRNSKSDPVVEYEKKIDSLEKLCLVNPTDKATQAEIISVRAKLWAEYRKTEREWLQKSRLKWFKEGDKNTKKFHLTAVLRGHTNQISKLKVHDSVFKNQSGIQHVFVNHFRSCYNEVNTIPLKKFDIPFKRINSSSSRWIERPFSEEEVWFTILSSDGSRAPGPDGFSLDFFKKFWMYVKSNVMKFLDDFYWGKISDFSFNKSFITLIPKKLQAVYPEDFRPISLVGSIYKIVARVLAKRMAACINEVIGENQFAFLADFSKAYDTVDWDFMNFILKKMGFGKRWRKWIHLCISTPKIDVLVNGCPSQYFSIKRGLRQGCPLSPFLFNVVGEALSGLLKKAVALDVCRGVHIGRSNVVVSHIQFADDLILFSEANEDKILNLFRVMRIFEVVAGLKLNLQKTKLFGINVVDERIKGWAISLRCDSARLPTLYLGLPLGYRKNHKMMWQPIVEKVRSRLQSWKGNLLSFGGRITLIKSVLVNLPVYYMSLFSMPKSIADMINKCISSFLWNVKADRGIHWIKWDMVCGPKSHGGLGFFDVKVRNRALLNKWIWRFSEDTESLWKKIIVAKYNYDPLAILPKGISARSSNGLWKEIVCSVISNEEDFLLDVRCVMGNGVRIDFWSDFWTGVRSLKEAFPRIYGLVIKKQGKISEFGSWVNGLWSWNIELRRELFSWEIPSWNRFNQVINSGVSTFPGVDSLKWSGASNGIYNSRDFCIKLASVGKLQDPLWYKVWNKFAPPKVAAFVWKAMYSRLPVASELMKRGVNASVQPLCLFCKEHQEDVSHVLCHCSVVWQVWQRWCYLWRVRIIFPIDVRQLLQVWSSQFIRRKVRNLWHLGFFGLIWQIWLCRNKSRFNGASFTVDQLFNLVLLQVGFWGNVLWPTLVPQVLDFVRCPDAIIFGCG